MTIYKSTKEQSWSPNKMFDALAAGKPVLINVDGWLGDTIEKNKCGIRLNPQNPATLADAVEQLSNDKELIQKMGRNARRIAETQFARDKLASQVEKQLHDTIEEFSN